MAQKVKNLPTLGGKDPLEKGMATHSSILAWRIPWTEEPCGLQYRGQGQTQWVTNTFTLSALRPYYLKWGPRSQGSTSPGNFKWRLLGPPRVSESEFCTQSVCACMPSHFSRVQLFVILWTVARKASLSMGFSRQEYWSGLSCPPPRDLLHPGIEPSSLMPPALAGGFFTPSATWEA